MTNKEVLMPRPRKNQEGPSATERMEDAFWEALAEKPYGKISVGEIARRSHVNKNAFYYHYDNLYALAAQAIDGILPRELARMILLSNGLDGIPVEAIAASPDIKRRSDRARLVAGPHGSHELAALLKSRILAAWLDICGVAESDLDREALLSIKFALGGLMEVIGDEQFLYGTKSVPEALFGSAIMKNTSKTVLATLQSAAEGYGCSEQRKAEEAKPISSTS